MAKGDASVQGVRGDRRVLLGWVMYDWANSAYATTIVAAVLPIYFASVVVPQGGAVFFGRAFAAETLWGWMVGLSALVVFATAPVLGAVADFANARKRMLLIFCYTGAVATALLGTAGAGAVLWTAGLFLLSQIGFVGANVFYDAFLPLIAPPGSEDRLSSRGFAYGYLGGGLHFALSLVLISFHERFGLSEPAAARIAMASAALWWGGFALVTAFLLREPGASSGSPAKGAKPSLTGYARLGFRRVWRTTLQVRRLRDLTFFLLAFMVYNDGIQTVISMATMYGRQELQLGAPVLMATLLMIQFIAMGGAVAFGQLADRIGAKAAILVALVGWTGVVVSAYWITTAVHYMVLGALVGIVLGGSQALSRSLYAVMIPERASAEFYGFYSVFAKFSAIGGPIALATVRHLTGSFRQAILFVIVFFLLGMLLLLWVRPERAREASAALEGELLHEGI
ncbi:MAG: MFS transporter [Candidatus Poribacteria bacterium]|nr:MAG: MFS transporter [Candidatus Poribacteria bacterium]